MQINTDVCRAGTLLAALLYMMTVYQRCRCPVLASAIASHLDCLSRHPDVDSTIREVALGMHDEWQMTAGKPDAAVTLLRPALLN